MQLRATARESIERMQRVILTIVLQWQETEVDNTRMAQITTLIVLQMYCICGMAELVQEIRYNAFTKNNEGKKKRDCIL